MAKSNEQQQPQLVDAEPSSPQTQLLREGAQIMKLESQEMFQLAIMRPREPKKILAEAIAAFNIFPNSPKRSNITSQLAGQPNVQSVRQILITKRSVLNATRIFRKHTLRGFQSGRPRPWVIVGRTPRLVCSP